MRAQNQVAECKDYNPSEKQFPLSTIKMDFLILRALTLLRLLLRSLQVQWWLCVVVGKGLRVERIHQTLKTSQTSYKLLHLRGPHLPPSLKDAGNI